MRGAPCLPPPSAAAVTTVVQFFARASWHGVAPWPPPLALPLLRLLLLLLLLSPLPRLLLPLRLPLPLRLLPRLPPLRSAPVMLWRSPPLSLSSRARSPVLSPGSGACSPPSRAMPADATRYFFILTSLSLCLYTPLVRFASRALGVF
jgi:hypothetical protein